MSLACSWIRNLSLGCMVICGSMLSGQVRSGGGNSVPSAPRVPATSAPGVSNDTRALFVHGKVVLAAGIKLTEPVAIERVCNGAVRKEGYTDFKGSFEIQLGQDTASRDATESGRDVFQNSGNRGPTQGMGSDLGITMPTTSRTPDATHPELLGCEIRASLPGFASTSVALRAEGSAWDVNVGTIVLTRMDNVQGATISLTTMSAPPEARNAYEKGVKAVSAQKYAQAEKELRKAVGAYPQFATAWSLLAEVHRSQNQFSDAREEYGRAIAADPQYVSPYFGLAVIAVNDKNWEDTVKYTAQAIKLNATAFPLAYMYNGAANFYLGHLEIAEESARQFQQLDSKHLHPESAVLLSNILVARHDYDGAAQQLEDYLRLVPNAPNAAEVKNQLQQLKSMNVAKKPQE